MPSENAFLLAGLFLLLAAAGWAMGRFGEREEREDHQVCVAPGGDQAEIGIRLAPYMGLDTKGHNEGVLDQLADEVTEEDDEDGPEEQVAASCRQFQPTTEPPGKPPKRRRGEVDAMIEYVAPLRRPQRDPCQFPVHYV